MRGAFDWSAAQVVWTEAARETCASCGSRLWVCEHKKRYVQRLDGPYCLVRRNRWCPNEGCERHHRIERALEDLRFALPWFRYGLDVVLEVGERHLRCGDSLRRVARDLNERGVPLSQRNSCRLLRAFVALTQVARGDEEEVRARLRAQGGVVLMADGVQYDDRSPVLYLAWDAVSGEPLFGERKAFRSAEDLVPLLERVKAMEVPVIGVVSDKEKGLLPAVAKVFPDVRHQLCQNHFLGNCARGMAEDLRDLGEGVARRAEKVRRIAKRLHQEGHESVEHDRSPPSGKPRRGREAALPGSSARAAKRRKHAPAPPRAAPGPADAPQGGREDAPLHEKQLAAELCAMARHAARATGRAPLNPPEHVRHERLEAVRATVERAKEKGGPVRPSTRSAEH